MVAATRSSLSRRLSGPPSSAISAGEVGDQPRDIGLAERRRDRAHEDRGRPEPLDLEPEVRQAPRPRPRGGRIRPRPARPSRESSSAWLRRPPALARRAHPLEHQPLVRGMLVDDHQPVLGLGDDISRGDLAARDAERVVGDRRDRRLGRAACGVEASRSPNAVSPLANRSPRSGRLGPGLRQAAFGPRLSLVVHMHRRRGLLVRSAALAFLVERGAQPADDQPAHRLRDRESGPRSWPGGR